MESSQYVTGREWDAMDAWQKRQDVHIESLTNRLDQVDELVASNRAMRKSWDRLATVIATSAGTIVLFAIGIILFGRAL